jgi:uncharacterized protein YecE (DUF72 family)
MGSIVRFGTSSWTYKGWQGLVYKDVAAYGKAFERDSLAEFASCGRFDCAGVDSSFYRPPSEAVLSTYAAQVPPSFPLYFKVWQQLSAPYYTAHFGPPAKAGTPNELFLDSRAFAAEVAEPAARILGPRLGALMLEIPFVPPSELRLAGFLSRLHDFLSEVAPLAPIAVELRTAQWLHADYFALLAHHGAAHAFNVWTRMPLPHEVLERFPAALDCAPFTVCRALVAPGTRYEHAVERFSPYDRLQAISPAIRASILALIRKSLAKEIDLAVLINNRLEGCAPLTIDALREALAQEAEA